MFYLSFFLYYNNTLVDPTFVVCRWQYVKRVLLINFYIFLNNRQKSNSWGSYVIQILLNWLVIPSRMINVFWSMSSCQMAAWRIIYLEVSNCPFLLLAVEPCDSSYKILCDLKFVFLEQRVLTCNRSPGTFVWKLLLVLLGVSNFSMMRLMRYIETLKFQIFYLMKYVKMFNYWICFQEEIWHCKLWRILSIIMTEL